MDTPQAILPNRPTYGDYVKDAVRAQKLVVDPPVIKTGNGEIWDRTSARIRMIQNCGTNAVKYAVGDADATELYFHGILPPGTDQDDGFGGQLDCGRFIGRITIFSTAGTHRVVGFRARGPEDFKASSNP